MYYTRLSYSGCHFFSWRAFAPLNSKTCAQPEKKLVAVNPGKNSFFWNKQTQGVVIVRTFLCEKCVKNREFDRNLENDRFFFVHLWGNWYGWTFLQMNQFFSINQGQNPINTHKPSEWLGFRIKPRKSHETNKDSHSHYTVYTKELKSLNVAIYSALGRW